MTLRLRRFWKTLPLLAGLLFAVQALVAVPQHAFHGAEQGSSLPERAEHCDLCLALLGLDSSSAVAPPVEGLAETVFSVVAAYASFDYPRPVSIAQARGPPAV